MPIPHDVTCLVFLVYRYTHLASPHIPRYAAAPHSQIIVFEVHQTFLVKPHNWAQMAGMYCVAPKHMAWFRLQQYFSFPMRYNLSYMRNSIDGLINPKLIMFSFSISCELLGSWEQKMFCVESNQWGFYLNNPETISLEIVQNST